MNFSRNSMKQHSRTRSLSCLFPEVDGRKPSYLRNIQSFQNASKAAKQRRIDSMRLQSRLVEDASRRPTLDKSQAVPSERHSVPPEKATTAEPGADTIILRTAGAGQNSSKADLLFDMDEDPAPQDGLQHRHEASQNLSPLIDSQDQSAARANVRSHGYGHGHCLSESMPSSYLGSVCHKQWQTMPLCQQARSGNRPLHCLTELI